MLAMPIAAAAPAQPVVLAALADAEANGNRVELLERPPGLATDAFVAAVLEESGAAGWERTDRETLVDGVQVRMLAARGPDGGLLLYIPIAADGRAVCRVVKVRPVRTAQEERRRIDRFCVNALTASC
ncbi:MAG TPA: hypothetical protein VFQ67_01425 [Allosphingosinicella sp.]|jgi:hypothetical protein|nr:hypothetical protein [Allosphingosinicella sp.]